MILLNVINYGHHWIYKFYWIILTFYGMLAYYFFIIWRFNYVSNRTRRKPSSAFLVDYRAFFEPHLTVFNVLRILCICLLLFLILGGWKDPPTKHEFSYDRLLPPLNIHCKDLIDVLRPIKGILSVILNMKSHSLWNWLNTVIYQ